MKIIDFNNLDKNDQIFLNKKYISEKKSYVEFLTKLIKKQNIFVGFSTFFSRNNEYTLTFYYICMSILIKKNLKKESKIILKPKNFLQYLFFKKNFKNKKIEINYNKNIYEILIFYFIIFKKFAKLFNLIFFSIFEILNRSLKRLKKFQVNKNIILVDTTFIESSFKENRFKDRFYGNLGKIDKNIYFSPENLLSWKTKKYLKKIDKNINFILRSDVLKIYDYFWALKKSFFLKINELSSFNNYKGTNISIPQFVDLNSSYCNLNYFVGLLNYKFFERLKDLNCDLKLIINWNENQSADKGFVLGSKKFFNNIKVKGYAAYFCNYNYYFGHQSLNIENKRNYIPDELHVASKKYFKDLKKFNKDIKLKIAPLLRFDYLEDLKLNKKSNKNKVRNILLALPIEKNEALNLISYVNKIDHQKYLLTINFHPNYNKLDLKKLKNKIDHKFFENIIFSSKNFKYLVKKTDVVISSSSSTTVEAFMSGKFIISPLNSLYLIDTYAKSILKRKFYKILYNNENINIILKKIVLNKLNYHSEANILKKEIFDSVKKRLQKFLHE